MRERLLIIIPLAAAMVFIIARIKPVTAESKFSIYKRFWIVKTHATDKYNCVVCGDSRVYRGVSPQEMEDHLDGLTVVNLGYSSGSYSNFMMDRMEERLDKSTSPKVLVLGITPYSLTPKASLDGQVKQELARKKEEIFESMYLQPFQLFFEPYEIKWKKGEVEPVRYDQEFFNNGWVASDKIPHDPMAAIEEYTKDFTGNVVSQLVIDTLMTRVQRWQQQGIVVVGMRPPTTPQMVKLEQEMSGFDEAMFSRRFGEAGGVWLEFPIEEYSSYDGSHLDKKSAIRFSATLAERVKEVVDKKTK
jgi:hypothetical protein